MATTDIVHVRVDEQIKTQGRKKLPAIIPPAAAVRKSCSPALNIIILIAATIAAGECYAENSRKLTINELRCLQSKTIKECEDCLNRTGGGKYTTTKCKEVRNNPPPKPPVLPQYTGAPPKPPVLPQYTGAPPKPPALPQYTGAPPKPPVLPQYTGAPPKPPVLPQYTGAPPKPPVLPPFITDVVIPGIQMAQSVGKPVNAVANVASNYKNIVDITSGTTYGQFRGGTGLMNKFVYPVPNMGKTMSDLFNSTGQLSGSANKVGNQQGLPKPYNLPQYTPPLSPSLNLKPRNVD